MTKRELIDYCLTYADCYEDYPFDEEWACMRHKANQKTFAFIIEREGKLIVNLKCEPMRSDFLRSVFPAVVPGYHMNKTHWNTVYVNEIDFSEVREMISHSFELTAPKRRAAAPIPQSDCGER